MSRTIHCIKLDKEAEGLDFAPTPGKLGERIYESVSKEACRLARSSDDVDQRESAEAHRPGSKKIPGNGIREILLR